MIGRVLSVMFTYLEESFKLVCVYAPVQKTARMDLLEILRLCLVGRGNTIVAGDFNHIRTVKDRVGQGESHTDVTSTAFIAILQDFCLQDGAVCYYVKGKAPSYKGIAKS